MNTEIASYLEKYDFEYFLNSAIERVPENIDIREGSIIYDAIAPVCYEMAMLVHELRQVRLDSFSQTAVGNSLDLKAQEHGVIRLPATNAYVKALLETEEGTPFLSAVEGNRFSSTGDAFIYYTVVTNDGDGFYTLKAETVGVFGNTYIGDILPVDNFNGLGSAKIAEIIIPARSEESDDSLRERMLKNIQILDFGGNIEDYIQFTSKLEGVGAVQVYPIWDGGGTVKVVVLDSQFDIPNGTLLESIQLAISPGKSEKGYGIAPIGHQTTIAAPEKRIVNVSLHVDTIVGKTEEDVKPAINEKINEFFLSLRKTWQDHDDAYRYKQVIYQSQLIASLLFIDGVANISNVTLNGLKEDLALVNNDDLQECPFLGEVTYT